MTPNLSLLQDVSIIQDSCYITLPNGKKTQIKHVGTMALNSELVLKDVLHSRILV